MAEASPIDDKGRVAIPKAIRERLGLRSGEKLAITTEGGEIRMRPEVRQPRKVRSRVRWGKNAFPDTGEALFGSDK